MRSYYIKNGILIEYRGNAEHAIIPNDVTEIGDGAFDYCQNLTSIKIPSSVTCIASNAFCGCIRLKKINIPSSVTYIGNEAFSSCYNIRSIEIPNSVTHIGEFAFDNCKSLSSVVVPNNIKKIAWSTFNRCTSLTSVNIPDSVTVIDTHAFDGCTSLNSINIPSSVTEIGFCAFEEINRVKPQYNANGTLRAFKGFNKDWTCRIFQYEVGKSYHQEGKIKCCVNGFHACTNPLSVFNYYYGNLGNLHFAEVELSGDMDEAFGKVAASNIKIVRELTVSELAEIYSNMEKC